MGCLAFTHLVLVSLFESFLLLLLLLVIDRYICVSITSIAFVIYAIFVIFEYKLSRIYLNHYYITNALLSDPVPPTSVAHPQSTAIADEDILGEEERTHFTLSTPLRVFPTAHMLTLVVILQIGSNLLSKVG